MPQTVERNAPARFDGTCCPLVPLRPNTGTSSGQGAALMDASIGPTESGISDRQTAGRVPFTYILPQVRASPSRTSVTFETPIERHSSLS
jgi:hypothetical protein